LNEVSLERECVTDRRSLQSETADAGTAYRNLTFSRRSSEMITMWYPATIIEQRRSEPYRDSRSTFGRSSSRNPRVVTRMHRWPQRAAR